MSNTINELPMTDDIFNQIWTAGCNSGIKISVEISEGFIGNNKFEIEKRTQELIKEDADSISELWRLKKSMGG